MIALALAEKSEKARETAESLARLQKHRLIKPIRMTELETKLGYACVIAREGELILEDDLLAACTYFPLESSRILRALAEVGSPIELRRKLHSIDGFYSGAIVSRDWIALFRDHVGHMPLAYRDEWFAACLERRALGLGARQLPPGSILVLRPEGRKIERWYEPKARRVDDPPRILAESLLEVAGRYLPARFHLGFSGGLDSSILAFLGILLGRKVEAIVIGVEGCLDHRWAEDAARLLDLPLKLIEVSDEEILEAAEIIRRNLPEAGRIDLAIGSIMYLAALRSERFLVVGQGADELFGGYWKYEDALRRDWRRAEELMRKDLDNIHLRNLERDEVAAALAGSQLAAPYLARSIYELAYSMSLELKLRKVNGKIVRKWVLRKAAERLGVPAEIVQRSKKAAQYSSGIQKKLKKLLSRAGDRLDR